MSGGRAEGAILAGTTIRVRRIVPVVAFANRRPDSAAAALVRLNAIAASTSHAEFAANDFDGKWARAESLRSAWTCSMIAWPRWVLSAVTVSRVLVVKNAWNRHMSNNVGCPTTALGLSSGIRRTTRRPGTCAFFLCEVNAVNGISATSAREIHRPDGWSNTAFGYLIGVHASSLIVLITALICFVCRTVIDTAAPARRA